MNEHDVAPPPLDSVIGSMLVVPIRSSSGVTPDPAALTVESMRHGTDDEGRRFLAAFSSRDAFAQWGPPGSDAVVIDARDLFERADAAHERVVIDPGAPTQIEIAEGVLPFLAAGIDPNRPDALRARRPLGEVPPLEEPEQVPEGFGEAVRRTLAELPQVERAWLLRSGTAWTAGIQLTPDAELGDFDDVRNRLHAVATDQLGSRRLLAVTDLRAPALREAYNAIAAPYYVARQRPRGFLSRLLGD